jgi:hypothetical protein
MSYFLPSVCEWVSVSNDFFIFVLWIIVPWTRYVATLVRFWCTGAVVCGWTSWKTEFARVRWIGTLGSICIYLLVTWLRMNHLVVHWLALIGRISWSYFTALCITTRFIHGLIYLFTTVICFTTISWFYNWWVQYLVPIRESVSNNFTVFNDFRREC